MQNSTRLIIQTSKLSEGRTLNMVQVSPRRYKVVLESKPWSTIDGHDFVSILRSANGLTKAAALAKFNEFKTA